MTLASPGSGPVSGLGLAELREGYRAGRFTPVDVVNAVYDRIEARGSDGVWISLVPRAEAVAAAAGLPRGALPLLGIPYAVKDNIDVAGMVTTAASPDFAYRADADAPAVARLRAAGAVLIGKANLDQFATGLNGTRSPYGIPASVADPALISGGSSSGSAVAVAAGLVSFALGTDTAGSGRVPAALNGIVGIKPSIGLLPTTGVVPACRSLDCVSVFALSVDDAAAVTRVAAGDPVSPTGSLLPNLVPPVTGLRLAVPAAVPRWGERGEEKAWQLWCDGLVAAGAELVPVDMEPWWAAGRELYHGPWVAERALGLEEYVDAPGTVAPVATILRGGLGISGTEVFAGLARMAAWRSHAHEVLAGVDALMTPTVTETFTIEQMLADPLALNVRLGLFTTFTNLLDLCAVSLPVGEASGVPFGVPFGVTVQGMAGTDRRIAAIAAALSGRAPGVVGPAADDELDLAVVGAHLRGMPLHHQVTEAGAALVAETSTAASYRLYALADTTPAKPGLVRVREGGAAIAVEVYRFPRGAVGTFLAGVAAPLGLGSLTLADGTQVHGFICEPDGLAGATDITSYGGWRAWLDRA